MTPNPVFGGQLVRRRHHLFRLVIMIGRVARSKNSSKTT
jgi:hypothetical protein